MLCHNSGYALYITYANTLTTGPGDTAAVVIIYLLSK